MRSEVGSSSIGGLVSPRTSRRSERPASCDEAVKPAGVLAVHLAGHVGRKVLELLADVFLRLGPDAVGVRIVRAPHQRLDAHLLDQLGADAIVLERRLALPPPVLAGLEL